MKKRYYKPKRLVIGIVTFAFSSVGLGWLYGMINPNKYLFILSIIGIIIGEGLILDSASEDWRGNLNLYKLDAKGEVNNE